MSLSRLLSRIIAFFLFLDALSQTAATAMLTRIFQSADASYPTGVVATQAEYILASLALSALLLYDKDRRILWDLIAVGMGLYGLIQLARTPGFGMRNLDIAHDLIAMGVWCSIFLLLAGITAAVDLALVFRRKA